MKENPILMTAAETSKKIFQGKRSAWSLLQDAKQKKLPALKIGNRVFFEAHSLNDFITSRLNESIATPPTTFSSGITRID